MVFEDSLFSLPLVTQEAWQDFGKRSRKKQIKKNIQKDKKTKGPLEVIKVIEYVKGRGYCLRPRLTVNPHHMLNVKFHFDISTLFFIGLKRLGCNRMDGNLDNI